MQLPIKDVDVKIKMLLIKSTIGALTALVIGSIVKEEIKVIDDAEEKLLEKKRQREEAQQADQT